MKDTTKAVIIRFARGLAYALAGSAIAYAATKVDTLADLAPRYAFMVPIVSAALLAADKYIRRNTPDKA